MTQPSDKTEVHQADQLSPAPAKKDSKPSVGVDKAKKGGDETGFAVSIEGQVYGVRAKTAQEAADKAKKLHKSKKES